MSGKAKTVPRVTRLVAGLAAASLAVHLALHFVRRKIYLTGLDNVVGDVHVWGAPPDQGRALTFLAAHAILLVVAFGAYAWLVEICRSGRTEDPDSRNILFAVPVAAALSAIPLRPYLSIDLCSYLMHGRIARSGMNPHVVPLYAVGNTRDAADLAPLGWRPVHGGSPYGPFHTLLERSVVSVSDSAVVQLIVFKIFLVACMLGTAWFIWISLAERPAAERLTGVVVFLWNPMVLIETAAEGHNDSTMSFFVAAALAAAIRGRSFWCVIALALAVLTKYVPVLLVLPIAVYLWRTRGRSDARRLGRDVVAGTAVAAVIALLLFSPYWEDYGAWKGMIGEMHPFSYANGVGRAAMTFLHVSDGVHTVLFAVVVAVMIFGATRVKDGKTLALAALVTMCVYDFIASRRIFPWYGVLPVALGALVPTRRVFWLLVAASLPLSVVGALQPVFVNRSITTASYLDAMIASQPFVGVLLPAAIFGAWLLRDSRSAQKNV